MTCDNKWYNESMKSERTTVRMTPEKKRRLKRLAHENYMNMSEFIHYLIEKALEEQNSKEVDNDK